MKKNANNGQLIWGVALVLMGIAVCLRIPQVVPNIEQIEQFKGIMPFVKFCLYFVAVALIWGGAKKILLNQKKDDI